MFYHVEGKITDMEPNLVAVDCGGVGYAVYVTANTLSCLSLGEKAKLYISESVGETNFDLYGFYTKSEKKCFEMLTSVSGIGPKAALSILSYNTPENLAFAIINNNEKALTVAPGIGKKIAQRVILELKDKIGKETSVADYSAPVAAAASGDSNMNEAMIALNVLGYTGSDIAPVLKKLDTTGMTSEQIIKAVLKHMVK